MDKFLLNTTRIQEKVPVILCIDNELESEPQYKARISAFLAQLAETEFELIITALDSNTLLNSASTQSSVLILCRDNAHAATLTDEFALHNQTVFWLPLADECNSFQLLPKTHWCLNSQEVEPLLPVFALLGKQQDAAIKAQKSEQKLAMLTECLGELSATLDAEGKVIESNAEFLTLLEEKPETVIGEDLLTYLTIPSVTAKTRMQHILTGLHRTHSMTRLPPFPIQLKSAVVMFDGFVGPLQHGHMLLVLRQIANWQNQDWDRQLAAHTDPVTLLLINPDDFAKFNQQHGQETGDQVLNEIMEHMTDLLRAADFASRYSGAVFAVHLPDTNEQQGQVLAARMRQMLRKKRFTHNELRLDFSFGLATVEAEEQIGEQSPLELFRRANAALQAARSIGGGTLVSWQPKFDANILANLDRMSGKFSNVPEDDFRLITLQWDIIRLIGNTHTLQSFSEQICQLLATGMHCNYTGLFICKGDGLANLSFSVTKQDSDVKAIHQWAISNIQPKALLNSTDCSVEHVRNSCQAVVPLVTHEECLGVILLRWPLGSQSNASKHLALLRQVAANLATAIERNLLLEQERNRRVKIDKTTTDNQELLFDSASMRTLMQQVQLVAPTDATVLLIGESGTGKEVIAKQIHNHSATSDKPFITVDCSTIVEHLIESELFGHRKGAFTGATSDQPGMIAQADGGTLFLDEVGELPLDIQSKLLRFVQEKTFVAVGDQRVRKVDVRLIFATNRSLPDEVAAGRFRGDLYYRINVFTLNLPPLSQRGNDILLLARYFTKKFSEHYNKKISDVSSSAAEKLTAYNWPGNVRELRNCIMRGIILCSGKLLEPEHLILQMENVIENNLPGRAEDIGTDYNLIEDEKALLHSFELLLENVVEVAMQHASLLPISEWLEKQWLDVCLNKWASLYQVAQQLNLSESTLRRRYTRLENLRLTAPLFDELAAQCSSQLQRLIDENSYLSLWTTIERSLQKVVIKQQLSQQAKAKLLNVTQPTLRKITQQF